VNRGLWYGAAAYIIWGTFPLYWRHLKHVPSLEVLAHRIVWSSAALLLIVLTVRGAAAWRSITRRVLRQYAIAAVLIAINWLTYIWGVNTDQVVQVSLGYFITPLVNVLLGVVIFREWLRPMQWTAVALAAAGVAWLTLQYGALPWLAFGLAFSFGGYGLVKKKAALPPLEGLTLETVVLLMPAVLYLLFGVEGDAFRGDDLPTDLLLIGGGLVTIGPLLLFASAVREVPLTAIGILQYFSPTISFLLGVLLLGEPFSRAQFIGFAFVWVAIALFAIDSLNVRSVRLQADPTA
jgi:chloramphenicol-sensitive protein RarD